MPAPVGHYAVGNVPTADLPRGVAPGRHPGRRLHRSGCNDNRSRCHSGTGDDLARERPDATARHDPGRFRPPGALADDRWQRLDLRAASPIRADGFSLLHLHGGRGCRRSTVRSDGGRTGWKHWTPRGRSLIRRPPRGCRGRARPGTDRHRDRNCRLRDRTRDRGTCHATTSSGNGVGPAPEPLRVGRRPCRLDPQRDMDRRGRSSVRGAATTPD